MNQLIKVLNGESTTQNFNGVEGMSLSTVLSYSAISELGVNDSVELRLNDACTYVLTEAMQFKCNLKIIGSEDVIIKIRVPQIVDESPANSPMHNDDYYLGCRGTVGQGVDVTIKDVTFIFGNYHTYPFLPAKGHASHSCVKIKNAKSVTIENVRITVTHDCVNNILIYDSHNVLVHNCSLSNTHAVKTQDYPYTDIGGNLWFIGNNYNVEVRDNYFYKEGNDEVFSFYYQGAASEPDGYDYRRDISVENNTFKYGSLNSSGGYCDTFITIQSDDEQRPIHFNRMAFNGNHFIINDLVKNIVWMMIQNPLTTMEDVQFSGNLIELGEFASTGFTMNAFRLDASSHFQKVEAVIRDNRLVSSCSVNSGDATSPSAGLRFAAQNGGKLVLERNIVSILDENGSCYTDSQYQEHPTQDTHRLLFLYRNGHSAETAIVDNHANGLCNLVHITSPNDEFVDGHIANYNKRITNCDLRIENNFFSGCTRIYANKTDHLKVIFNKNVIKSNYYYYGFQNYADFSDISYCYNKVSLAPRPESEVNGNVTYASISGSFYLSGADAVVERMTLAYNTITGGTVPLGTNISADYELDVHDNEYNN